MSFRQDIQALRGIAVLLVVFYHAQLFPLVGGYLGVDVFFVISGFLITGQIHKQLANGNFSFREFYLRRAWRLLPAAYLMFALCILTSPWILTQSELIDFRAQVVGAVSFTANIVLWNQTGYFENAAELKPLLHTWSLAIEEQYYLIVPVVLSCIAVRKHLAVVCLVTLISLATLAYFSNSSPSASFYLTPARIWELGIGSIIALLAARNIPTQPTALYSYVALPVLAVICCVFLPAWPITEINNLIVTVCTALLILHPLRVLSEGPSSKVLAWFGDISYSLYLVHWPLFAFLNTATIYREPTFGMRLSALLVSVLAAVVLNRYLEQKLRILHSDHNRPFFPLIACSALLVLCGYLLPSSSPTQDFKKLFATNWGLSKECGLYGAHESALCRSHPRPEMLVWGDSFGMHLTQALSTNNTAKFIQTTKSECAPLTSISYYTAKRHPVNWGEECLKFNQKSLMIALNDDTIKTVVLASLWDYMLTAQQFTALSASTFELVPADRQNVLKDLKQTMSQLSAAGKKVILVSPPPGEDFNIAKCHERSATGLLNMSLRTNCAIDRARYQTLRSQVNDFIDSLEGQGFAVYRFDDYLCDDTSCTTLLDGEILYRDEGHLSIRGSELYGRKFHLYESLMRQAR